MPDTAPSNIFLRGRSTPDSAVNRQGGCEIRSVIRHTAYRDLFMGYKDRSPTTRIAVNFFHTIVREHVNAYAVGFKGALAMA